MSDQEFSTSPPSPKKSHFLDWILPTIIGMTIVKVFGLAGGLVTIGAYYWLKSKIGYWGAIAASVVVGLVTAIGLSAIIANVASPSTPSKSVQKPNVDSEGWTQESTGSAEEGPWLSYSPAGTRYCRYADRTIQRLYPPGARPNLAKANPFCLGDSSETVPP